MNRTIGKIGASVTGLSVLAFAVSLLFGLRRDTLFESCLFSIFIAIGFLPFMISLHAVCDDVDTRAAGLSGIAFSVVYAIIIFLVYYAECTTVRMNLDLSEETLSVISYGHVGSLFFNYDLLGYGFMGLSTLLIGFTVKPMDNAARALRAMLWIHGLFFLPCLILPMFPLFHPGTGTLPATLLLEGWCAYFLPVCFLGYRYFDRAGEKG